MKKSCFFIQYCIPTGGDCLLGNCAAKIFENLKELERSEKQAILWNLQYYGIFNTMGSSILWGLYEDFNFFNGRLERYL